MDALKGIKYTAFGFMLGGLGLLGIAHYAKLGTHTVHLLKSTGTITAVVSALTFASAILIQFRDRVKALNLKK